MYFVRNGTDESKGDRFCRGKATVSVMTGIWWIWLQIRIFKLMRMVLDLQAYEMEVSQLFSGSWDANAVKSAR